MQTTAFPSVKGKVSAEEWQARVDLAAAYRLIAMNRWDDLVFTPLTAKIPGAGDQFLINPYGMLFEEITASSLVKIDVDDRKLDVDNPFPVNPAGFNIHSSIHSARRDAKCVMHTDTAHGIASSQRSLCRWSPEIRHKYMPDRSALGCQQSIKPA